jgi:sugar lactone lactonase YvrE
MVAIKSFLPGFRLRVGEAPWALPYPGGTVQTNITFLNLSYIRKFNVKTLTSPQFGNLTTACGLPRTIGKDRLLTCRLDVPLTGPIGTRPSASFTASGRFKNGAQATANGSIDIVIEPPVNGAPLSMIVGNDTALTSNDSRLFDQLDAQFDVTVYDDSTVMPSDLETSTAAVLTPSVIDSELGTRLTDAPTPIVIGQDTTANDFGLVATDSEPDIGDATGKAISIVDPLSALAGNQFGSPNYYTDPKTVSWVKPRPSAELVGQFANGQGMLLAYDRNDTMVDGSPFPACRTYLPMSSAVDFSAIAWKLFDRAVAYSMFDCGRGMLWSAVGDGSKIYPGNGHQASDVGLDAAWGITIDATGNVYVVDQDLHSVRKIAPDGVVTTVAGTGVAGSSGDGGPATAARLNLPTRVTAAADGSLYIADSGNNKIRRVSPGGTISTVAGTGIAGFSGDNGPATSARLSNPYDVEVSGNSLYIADRNNNRIRRVDLTTGVITTVAGTGTSGFTGDGGPATSARIADPRSVTVDTAGNLYIADTGNQRVRRVDTGGVIDTFAGTGLTGNAGDGGLATEADLHVPVDLTVSASGTLYICELNNNRVRRVQDGFIDTFAGTGEFGFTGDGASPIGAKFDRPSASALDAQGNLWVVDRDNERIRVINAT